MARSLTVSLITTTLQKLEAIRNNESEVLSDEDCNKRAAEVAEAAIESIAVCAKYLLSRNAEARIDGFGDFYLEGAQVRFIPDQDVVQYAILKQPNPEQQQLALRNAALSCLSQSLSVIRLLHLEPGQVSDVHLNMSPDENLLRTIFGETSPNNFEQSVSLLLSKIIQELHSAGAKISPAVLFDARTSRVPGTALDETAEFWDRVETARDGSFHGLKPLGAQPWVEPEKPLIEKPHIRKQGEES